MASIYYTNINIYLLNKHLPLLFARSFFDVVNFPNLMVVLSHEIIIYRNASSSGDDALFEGELDAKRSSSLLPSSSTLSFSAPILCLSSSTLSLQETLHLSLSPSWSDISASTDCSLSDGKSFLYKKKYNMDGITSEY